MFAAASRASRVWSARSKTDVVAKSSAGLLVYRLTGERLEVLLVHPGGPFFKKRDEGSWSIRRESSLPAKTRSRRLVVSSRKRPGS